MSMGKKTIGFTILVLLGVIGIVILFQAGAALITPFNNAGLANSQLCTNAGCSWNDTRSVDCTSTNTTPQDTTECSTAGFEQPLGSFFESNGLMPLVLGAVFVIVGIVGLVVLIKKRRG